MAFIKGIDRNQRIMLPEYVEDYIEKDNLVRVIDELLTPSTLREWALQSLKKLD